MSNRKFPNISLGERLHSHNNSQWLARGRQRWLIFLVCGMFMKTSNNNKLGRSAVALGDRIRIKKFLNLNSIWNIKCNTAGTTKISTENNNPIYKHCGRSDRWGDDVKQESIFKYITVECKSGMIPCKRLQHGDPWTGIPFCESRVALLDYQAPCIRKDVLRRKHKKHKGHYLGKQSEGTGGVFSQIRETLSRGSSFAEAMFIVRGDKGKAVFSVGSSKHKGTGCDYLKSH